MSPFRPRLVLLAAALLATVATSASATMPRSSVGGAAPSAILRTATAPLLDINSASKGDLMALKGVGDKRADDIIKGRPYKGKDDLVSRKILSQGVYDGIKDKIIARQK